MVILVSKEGQLANRLWHVSSFLVNAKKNEYKVLHLFFDDYYKFFSESLQRKNTPVRFLAKRKSLLVSFLQTVLSILVRGLLKVNLTRLPFFEIVKYTTYEQEATPFDLNDERYLKIAKSKLVLIYGWLFRDPENQKRYRDLLLDTWAPNKNIRIRIYEYYTRYKMNHDVLIGVHIRGGDYKKFEGGKWYYTPEQYFEKIKEVAMLKIFDQRKIAFVICTNEKIKSFSGAVSFTIFNEERHFIEDLYLLAKCDYIIGPPSTFTMWASFYGGVPVYFIKDAGIILTDQTFEAGSFVF